MTRHVILAHGRETEYQRAIFSVLSFWAWYEGDQAAVQTVIFTDRPEAFASHFGSLPVSYQLLTPASIEEMRGEHGYIHRLKLYIVDKVAQDYPGEAVFFCDSDTFFTAPAASLLRSLQPGTSLLHMREHTFNEAIAVWASFSPPQDGAPRKFVGLLANQTFELLPGTAHRFDANQMMWNTGVIGVAPDSAELTKATVALGDIFYGGSEWGLSEQAAFSLALQTDTEILPSNAYVFHYWGERQKTVMDGLLADWLTTASAPKPLESLLPSVKKLTSTWRQVVSRDEAQQAAKLAFSRGELVNGMKYTTKALLGRVLLRNN